MFNSSAVVNTVWVKPLEVKTFSDPQGSQREQKSILLKVATRRPYKVKDEHGNKVPVSDFMLCKAVGPIAQVIANNCSQSVLDEAGKEKLVSRKLAIYGRVESYQSERMIEGTTIVSLSGKKYKVPFKTKVQQTNDIFVINSLEFLDYKEVEKVEVAEEITELTEGEEVTELSDTEEVTAITEEDVTSSTPTEATTVTDVVPGFN